MKAMILAAGRGERLRPLTDSTPKPLIKINNKPLIVYHIEALKQAGIDNIIINVSYLANQIMDTLDNGQQFGVTIEYSIEQEGALETGGGIVNALPLLGNNHFIVINADIFTNFNYASLLKQKPTLAHLVVVNNPKHNSAGDYCLENNRIFLPNYNKTTYTFSGIAVYHPQLLNKQPPHKFSITQLIKDNIKQQVINGELYQGKWLDIGTLERLHQADKPINEHPRNT